MKKRHTMRRGAVAAVVALTLAAALLRTWHVGSWLHYELDQARDYRVIHAAMVYGPGELPLQGPKAAGNVRIADKTGALTDKTTLRLGPAFYYLEYVSALLFGDTPLGSIVLIIVLSIATVPLFYLFARTFFARGIALGLTAIVASSLFFVTYSRFGWNPNLLPGAMLLFAYGLLQATDTTRSHRARGWWLVAAAAALAFAGQLHFLAFTAAPVIGVAYLLWSWRSAIGREGIAPRFWALAVLVFLIFQIPLAINDAKTGGENTKAFLAALTQKSAKDPHTLTQKVVRNVGNHSKYVWLILTGDQRAELPVITRGDIRCDYDCRRGLLRGALALALLAAAAAAWVVLYRRTRSVRKRHFLRITALWFGVVFVAYVPLSYSMAPRFFLLHGVTFVVALGLALALLRDVRGGRGIAAAVLAAAVAANLAFVGRDFAQRARAMTDATLVTPTDYVLKEKTRMPFAQMMRIVAHIRARHMATGWPVWLHAQAEFKRAFWERLDSAGVPRFGAPTHLERAYREGLYFIILRTGADHAAFLAKTRAHARIVDKRVFGTLTLYELRPHDDVIVAATPKVITPRRDPRFSASAQVRYLWRQVWQ